MGKGRWALSVRMFCSKKCSAAHRYARWKLRRGAVEPKFFWCRLCGTRRVRVGRMVYCGDWCRRTGIARRRLEKKLARVQASLIQLDGEIRERNERSRASVGGVRV